MSGDVTAAIERLRQRASGAESTMLGVAIAQPKDVHAVLAEVERLRADEATRLQLIDSLSHVDEATDPVLLATRVLAALQGDPEWESVEVVAEGWSDD